MHMSHMGTLGTLFILVLMLCATRTHVMTTKLLLRLYLLRWGCKPKVPTGAYRPTSATLARAAAGEKRPSSLTHDRAVHRSAGMSLWSQRAQLQVDFADSRSVLCGLRKQAPRTAPWPERIEPSALRTVGCILPMLAAT